MSRICKLGTASLTLLLAVHVGFTRPAAAEREQIAHEAPSVAAPGDIFEPAPIGEPAESIPPCLHLVQTEGDTETLPRSIPSVRVESNCDASTGEPEAAEPRATLPTFQFFTDFVVDPAAVLEGTRSALVTLLTPAL